MNDTEGITSNVDSNERLLTVLGGGALIAYSLRRSDPLGWLGLAAGASLLLRGISGFCPGYKALGKSSPQAHIGGEGRFSRPVPGHGGVLAEQHVTINRSAEELYAFWRKFENLPQVMQHLKAVEETDATHSHWVAAAPAGLMVEWDAEITRDDPNELIAWRSLPGASVPNSGSVQFTPATGGRGTQVRVLIEYQPIGGAVGAAIAALFGEEPRLQITKDLNRFKQLMEAGEVPTIEGQPHGGR